MQRAATTGTFRILAHGQVEILARTLLGKATREYGGVALGGHAAVVVASDVAGDTVRQEPLFSASQAHTRIIHEERGLRRGPLSPMAES